MAKLTGEQLLEIFNSVKKELAPFEKGTIKARINIEGKYDLWSEKPNMMVQGKMRNEMAFVSLILQSSYVGFYYMPIYTNPEELRTMLSPELLKLLKGKACFHIKTVRPEIITAVRDAMKAGYVIYKKNGWV